MTTLFGSRGGDDYYPALVLFLVAFFLPLLLRKKSSSFNVEENRSPFDALGRILSCCDLPSLDTKWRLEARILEWETRRRVDDHWERQLRSVSHRQRLCTEEEEEDRSD